jgi:hypothetical protein
MRGSFIFLLVIGLLLLSVSAEGANWKFIGKDIKALKENKEDCFKEYPKTD